MTPPESNVIPVRKSFLKGVLEGAAGGVAIPCLGYLFFLTGTLLKKEERGASIFFQFLAILPHLISLVVLAPFFGFWALILAFVPPAMVGAVVGGRANLNKP